LPSLQQNVAPKLDDLRLVLKEKSA
jgi:hypothetical protein